MKVLIIDDSRSVRKSVSWKLQKIGFDIVGQGSDGREGLDLFRELKPELTILDITMPNMDGRECLKGIFLENPEAKVIMLSALGSQDVMDECAKLGALDFIDKNQLMTEQYLENRVSSIVQAIRSKAA